MKVIDNLELYEEAIKGHSIIVFSTKFSSVQTPLNPDSCKIARLSSSPGANLITGLTVFFIISIVVVTFPITGDEKLSNFTGLPVLLFW